MPHPALPSRPTLPASPGCASWPEATREAQNDRTFPAPPAAAPSRRTTRRGASRLIRLRFVGGCFVLLAAIAGAARAAEELVYPMDLVVDREGAIVIADRQLPGVLRLAGGELQTLALGSRRFREPLNAVWCVAIDHAGRVLVGDSAARGVFRISAPGRFEKINTDYIGLPIRLAVDSQGRIYVSDLETQRIWRMPPEGGACEEFAIVAGVRGLAIDRQDRLWTLRANPPQLVRYQPDGSREILVTEGPFDFPHQLALSSEGDIAYVADGGANRCLWRVPPGTPPEKWRQGEPLVNPTGLAWQGENLLIVDPRAGGILRAPPEGPLEWVVRSRGIPAEQP